MPLGDKRKACEREEKKEGERKRERKGKKYPAPRRLLSVFRFAGGLVGT